MKISKYMGKNLSNVNKELHTLGYIAIGYLTSAQDGSISYTGTA